MSQVTGRIRRASLRALLLSLSLVGALVAVESTAAAQTYEAPPADGWVDQAPPPPRREIVSRAPSSNHFWVGGHWDWNGRAHSWVGGRWERRHDGLRFVPPHWSRWGRHWRFVPGHWQRVR